MDSIKPFSNPVKIPLHELLLANGYEIIRSKSTRLNPVLESPNGHRVVISLMPGGDYLYFNPNDNDDKGNIYNLVKNQNLNLSSLLENYFQIPITKSYNIEAKNYNESKDLVDKFLSLKNYNTDINHYLQNRALSVDIINLYNQMIKTDSYHNVYFPQYKLVNNVPLIKGYTMKLVKPIYTKDGVMLEKPIKSITKGTKGLEILLPNKLKDISKVIISESLIDSLSFFELSKKANLNEWAVLIGTGGNISIKDCIESLKTINEKLNLKDYYLCFDNDKIGANFRENFKNELFLLNCNVFYAIPQSKDFNDDLKLFKILKLDKNKYNFLNYSVERAIFKDELKCKALDLIEEYRYAKISQERSRILKLLRKVDSLYKIPREIKDKFANYKYKDKRIKGI